MSSAVHGREGAPHKVHHVSAPLRGDTIADDARVQAEATAERMAWVSGRKRRRVSALRGTCRGDLEALMLRGF